MRLGNTILNNLKEDKETLDSKFNQVIILLSDIIKEINNEDIKGKLSNISVDIFNIQSEVYRESKLNEDIDYLNATPEEIDDYNSNEFYNKAKEAKTPEEVFNNICYSTAASHMSNINVDNVSDGYLNMITNEAKQNYESLVSAQYRDKYTDEDFKNTIIKELENGLGVKINILEEIVYESLIEGELEGNIVRDTLIDDGDSKTECLIYVDKDNKTLGTLSYNILNGEYHIYNIIVEDNERRKGIATKLMKELQNIVGDNEIYFDTLTPSGKQLLDKIADYDVYKQGMLGANLYKGKIN